MRRRQTTDDKQKKKKRWDKWKEKKRNKDKDKDEPNDPPECKVPGCPGGRHTRRNCAHLKKLVEQQKKLREYFKNDPDFYPNEDEEQHMLMALDFTEKHGDPAFWEKDITEFYPNEATEL